MLLITVGTSAFVLSCVARSCLLLKDKLAITMSGEKFHQVGIKQTNMQGC